MTALSGLGWAWDFKGRSGGVRWKVSIGCQVLELLMLNSADFQVHHVGTEQNPSSRLFQQLFDLLLQFSKSWAGYMCSPWERDRLLGYPPHGKWRRARHGLQFVSLGSAVSLVSPTSLSSFLPITRSGDNSFAWTSLPPS